MNLSLVTAPTDYVVSIADAKLHCHVDDPTNEYDSQFRFFIEAARESCEQFTGRQLMQATWRLNVDKWPCDGIIYVPKSPLVSVTSVKYIDINGVQQTVSSADYDVDIRSEPGRIQPGFGKSWPTARIHQNSIEIIFVAGYANQVSIPAPLRLGMLHLISHWNENREAINIGNIVNAIDETASMLWWSFKVPWLGWGGDA